MSAEDCKRLARRAFRKEWNGSHSRRSMRAVMADDIVMKIVYGKPDDPMLEGKDAVLEVMQGSNDDHFTLETASLVSDGTKVTGNYSGIGDDIRAHNVGPEIGTVEALVKNGIIKTFTFVVDSEFNQKYEEAEGQSSSNSD